MSSISKINVACPISTSNHMFGMAIWNKFLSAFLKILKLPSMRMIYTKNALKQTCDYWLITSNQQTLYIETNPDIFIIWNPDIISMSYSKPSNIQKFYDIYISFKHIVMSFGNSSRLRLFFAEYSFQKELFPDVLQNRCF